MVRYVVRQPLFLQQSRRVLKRGEVLDPTQVSATALQRWLARRYVEAVDEAGCGVPVVAVPGIGPERAKGLRAAGIDSLEALVAADAATIEPPLANVTVAMIERWQAEARRLIAEAQGPPPCECCRSR